jgi:hypothetical protein
MRSRWPRTTRSCAGCHHRGHGPQRRRLERAGDAVHEGDDEQRERRRRVGEGVSHQCQRAEQFAAHGEDAHAATVEAVGHGTGDEDEQDGRQELGQTDEPDVGFAPGDVEDLLQQRCRLQRHAAVQHEVAHQQAAHRRRAPQIAHGVLWVRIDCWGIHDGSARYSPRATTTP